MNKRQKEVLQAQLNSEEEVIARLKSTYEQALGDCEAKIQELSMRADLEPEHIQTIIYQKQYQEAIKAQLEGALANLQSNSYATVSDYLTRSYQEGYLGAMYDMQGQGIPLVMPIDQEAVTRAVMLDTKLSTSLYNKMGEDVKILKKAVQQEVSRGIAQGMTWSNIASNLARNMKHTPFQKAYSNSIRIARTEGHRIQNNATLDAQKSAKDRGADIVKRWNAVLDGKTRDVHRELDGQVREIGEMFEAAGYKVEAPGMFGDPSQDCNCRCYLEQVPRWDLEGGMTKMDNFSKRIVAFETPDDYEEWKKAYWSDENIAYMNYVTDMEKKYGKNFETVLNSMTDKEYDKYKRLLDDNPMYKTEKPLVGHHGLDKTEDFEKFKSKYLNISEADIRKVDLTTSFIPAQTIEEAEEYIKQFIGNGYSPIFKNQAIYKGISVENANEINKVLTEVYSQYDLPKISGIKTISPTSTQGKKVFSSSDAVAAYNPIEHGIFINKNVLKNASALASYNEEAEKAWNLVMSNIDNLSGKEKELALLYKNAGRALVGNGSVHDYIIHEMGHHVQWNVLDTKINNAMGSSMRIYAPRISGYANASKSEYIAESFAAYIKGETKLLDPDFVKAINEYNKPLEKVGGSSTMKSTIVKDAIDSGKVSKTINVNKQNRHIKGSDGYIEGRSYIKGNVEDAQKFVDKLSGTGKPIIDSKGNWTNKERVEASETLGVHINPDDNSETETKKATIVYSKTGSHIIPRKDEQQ